MTVIAQDDHLKARAWAACGLNGWIISRHTKALLPMISCYDLWSLFDRLVMKDNFLMGNFVLFKPGKPLFQCWTSAEVTF